MPSLLKVTITAPAGMSLPLTVDCRELQVVPSIFPVLSEEQPVMNNIIHKNAGETRALRLHREILLQRSIGDFILPTKSDPT